MSLSNPDVVPMVDGPSRTPNLDALYREHAPTVARWAAKLAGDRDSIGCRTKK